jgi:hypothetical protein
MSAIAEPIRTVVDRVKSAVQGDPQSRLDAAINDVTRLQGELQRIGAEVAGRKFRLLGKCAANMPPLSVASSVMSADPQESWREFVRRHPEWREILRQACAIKLSIAEAEHSASEKRVREELADMQLREVEIMQHPRLKRTKSAVSRWAGLLTQCDIAKDAAGLWRSATKHLQ